MVIDFGLYDKFIMKPIKCAICRADIKNHSRAYQSRSTFAVVCRECRRKLTEDDIELMLNLFLAYGGYFGKLKDVSFSLEDTLKEILNDAGNKGEEFDLGEVNSRMVHKALLHGHPPQEYIDVLKSILLED